MSWLIRKMLKDKTEKAGKIELFSIKFPINREMQSLLKDVVRNVDYEKIILFGSRARDDFHERSDYDILLILSHSISIEEKIKLSVDLRRKFAQKGIDADIILKSKEETEYYKEKVGSVVRNALKEGVIL